MTRRIYIGLCALGVLAHAQVGLGQLFDRPTVLENVRIHRGDGQILEVASLIIKGNRIVEMGKDVKAPFLASRHDLSGRTITPGLIDAWSVLGLSRASGNSDALGRAWDAFDPYASDAFHEALRNGVTTFYLSPGRSPGINGVGAVVKLTANDDGSMGSLVLKDAALAISFGPADSPISRLKAFEEVRKSFRSALDYRESLEDYEEELKAYLEKLEVRRKEKEGDAKAKADGDDKKSPADTDKPKEESKETPKPAPKPDDKPGDGKGRQTSNSANNVTHSVVADYSSRKSPLADEEDDESGEGDKKKNDGKDKKDDKDKEKEALTKPTKPAVDRGSELLLRAIDHELDVRILAQRSDSITNALALAEEFNLDLTIEGATEAYLLVPTIAAAEVGLVLGQVSRSGLDRSKQFRRYRENQLGDLQQASVAWTVSSGAEDAMEARFVSFNAQLAASQADNVAWLSLVTTRAAKMLGVSRQAGFLGVGRMADLVVWSSDPSDPGAVVERVYVSGKLVYDRADDIVAHAAVKGWQ